MKPWRRRILFAALGAAGFVVALVLLEHVRGRLALNRETAALRARGEKLTVADLVPPTPPFEQNGAAAFLAAVGQFQAGRVVPNEVPSAWKPVVPGKTSLATRTREWPSSFQRGGSNVHSADQLCQEIEEARPVLEALRAALRKPALHFQFAYSQKAAISHLATAKAAASWLRAASLASLLDSNLEGALANLESAAILCQRQTEEKTIISQLVGMAGSHVLVASAWEALQTSGWSDAQLARMQAMWTGASFTERMAAALEMERAMTGEMFEQMSLADLDALMNGMSALWGAPNAAPAAPQNLDDLMEYIGWLASSSGEAARRYAYLPLWRIAWADQDQARSLRQWTASIEAARRGASNRSWQAVKALMPPEAKEPWPTDEEEVKPRALYDGLRFLVSDRLAGFEWRALRKAAEADTMRALALAATALRRHQLRHGSLPAELRTLTPGFLAAVPLDPMDGKPLRYRQTPEGGFVLYSVGENGVDDGGDATPAKPQAFPQAIRGRDIVWPAVATAEEQERAAPPRKERGK